MLIHACRYIQACIVILILTVMFIVVKKQKKCGIDTPTRPVQKKATEKHQHRTSYPCDITIHNRKKE